MLRVADSTGEVTHTQLPPHLPRPGAGMRGSCHVIRDTFPGSPRPDSQRPRRDGPYSWASPSPSAGPQPCHKATCLCLHLYCPPKDSCARIAGHWDPIIQSRCSPGGWGALEVRAGNEAGWATFQPCWAGSGRQEGVGGRGRLSGQRPRLPQPWIRGVSSSRNRAA